MRKDAHSLVAWANRFLNNVKPDTLPGWMAPMLADLLAATDRWSEIPAVLDVGVAKGVADSARGIGRPVEFPLFRDELTRRRAVALIHLGRRAEALAIDAELAREMACAGIAGGVRCRAPRSRPTSATTTARSTC